MDKVANLEIFSYDKKHNSIVRITHRKIKVTLDSGVVTTTEEVIIDTNKDKESQLYYEGLAISHASYDKEVIKDK